MFASFGIKGGTSTVEVDSAAAWALDEYQGLAEVDVAKAVAGNGFSTMINFVATHGADEVTFAIVTTSPGTHPAAAGAGIDWRVKSLGNTFAVFDGAVNGPSTIPLVEYVYSTQTNPTWNLIAASLHQ